MLIVEGWIRMEPADIDRLTPAAGTMIAATLKEEGCLAYAFARDLVDSGLLRLVERWRDEEALAAHFQTPHMAAFNQAIAGTTRLGGSVKVYTVDAARTLIGD